MVTSVSNFLRNPFYQSIGSMVGAHAVIYLGAGSPLLKGACILVNGIFFAAIARGGWVSPPMKVSFILGASTICAKILNYEIVSLSVTVIISNLLTIFAAKRALECEQDQLRPGGFPFGIGYLR